jgi:hypothetical protein
MTAPTLHPEHREHPHRTIQGNPLLKAALDYAAHWPIFPVWGVANGQCTCGKADCQHPGKHPIGILAPNGRNSATKDPAIIHEWWRRCPEANIGIVTGPESGLVVVDIDPQHGGHPDRLPGNLPRTLGVNTGGGGWHYHLAHPGEGIKFPQELPSRPGVDMKADGGYVVAPPSLHISGERYAWKFPPETIPLAPCPDWLLNLIKPPSPRPNVSVALHKIGKVGAYGRAALSRELARLAQAPEGSRNIALNKAAFSLGKLVAGAHLDEDTVINLLCTVGGNIGLGEKEVRATVKSGMKGGMGRVCNV